MWLLRVFLMYSQNHSYNFVSSSNTSVNSEIVYYVAMQIQCVYAVLNPDGNN